MSCESGLAILGNSLHCVLQNLEVSDSYARQAQAHAGFFRPEGPLLDCQDMFQFLQPSVLVANFRSAVVNCTRFFLGIWALGTKSRLHVQKLSILLDLWAYIICKLLPGGSTWVKGQGGSVKMMTFGASECNRHWRKGLKQHQVCII